MESLTVALSVLGGVVLAGVVAHGAWQARRAGPKLASARSERPEPVEPVMGDTARAGADVPAGAPERRSNRRNVARLDALIDAIATLTLDAPLAGDKVAMHLPTSRRAGAKPFLVEGLNADSGEWEAPGPGQRYCEFQAGVQLANRTGPLNEIEYSEFVQKAQAFADATGAFAHFPDMLDVVARGRELDGFASQCDAQLALRLRARNAAWSVAYIHQHAGHHGFRPGAVPGRLVLPAADPGAPPMLTLTFDSQAALADEPNLVAVREFTLNFDVPQTEASADPFAAWQAGARAIATDIDAAIVDDNGRPLSAEGFAAIGDELGQLYRTLEARDLAAGSAAARRLFS